MRSSILPLVVFVAATAGISAQQVAPNQQLAQAAPKANTASLYQIPQAHPCSVADMRATQGSSSQMLRTQNGKSTPMMRPTLTLKPVDRRAIVSATVTAHGYGMTPGSIDLVAQAVPPEHKATGREITKTIKIKFKPVEGGAFTAELPLPGFSAVTMIDLNSVTFGDGTVWKSNTRNECRVAPDPLLLIATDR